MSAFTARTNQQPTDDEFLVLENAIRELRAKYTKNGRGSETGSRGGDGGGRRGSAASGGGSGTRGSSKRGVSENTVSMKLRSSVGRQKLTIYVHLFIHISISCDYTGSSHVPDKPCCY